MAIGDDIKIYKPTYKAIKRQLKGKSTVQGQKELNSVSSLLSENVTGTGQAVNQGTTNRIAKIFGSDVAQANQEDVSTRYARAYNSWKDQLYNSERNFIEDIKSQGFENALNMYGSQLNAETDTMVNTTQNQTTSAIEGASQAFVGRQSELDRLLEMEQFNANMTVQRQQQKAQRQQAGFGLFGSILGAIPGIGGLFK